jgi:DNA repair protein RadC
MADQPTDKRSIKSWAEDDRPREKLLLKGVEALSDAELIAILLGSGSRNETAVDLAKKILTTFRDNVNDLGRASIADFLQFKGVGEAKAVTLLAALELGRRRQKEAASTLKIVDSSRNAYDYLKSTLEDLDHEQFWLVMLNRANRVIGMHRVSVGGVSGTVVDPKLVFRAALERKASAVILAHNHPSGANKPSQADINLTKKLVQAGKLLEISIHDHIIVTPTGYYSFSDHGMLHA